MPVQLKPQTDQTPLPNENRGGTRARAGGPAPPAAPVPSGLWRMLASHSRPAESRKLPKGIDAIWDIGLGKAQNLLPRRTRYLRRAERILRFDTELSELSDARLRERALELRDTFRLGRETKRDIDEAFAVTREAAWRTLGMKPYKVQVAAAIALDRGCICELATGEGKTLSATMPATIAGWRGRGCHVITVNDYLAQRDAEWMSKLYEFCGLKVAFVTGEMDPPARRAAYEADITYTTNKEVAADFLRDRLALGKLTGLTPALLMKMTEGRGGGTDRLVMRGLEYAIVDEADSVLVDEAVTPLIISGKSPNEEQVEAFKQAADVARELEVGRHYKVDHKYREVNLNERGRDRIAELTEDLGGIWAGVRRREEMVTQAVTARELFLLGEQYVIQPDEEDDDKEKVVIVDEFTGRLMPDREWRDGLHQAVSAKEGLEVEPPKDTLARVSFQRFFRLYRKLAGMTGTAWEARQEIWQIYHCPTVRIPTNKPCIRVRAPDRVFGSAESKWLAVVEEIDRMHGEGRPVLVGTRSVEASEHLSQLLDERELEHEVLNAVKHKEEAQIVAQAGQPGHITVATNMAGRGTDIKLGRGVPEQGGLAVIASERHEAGRIDRQLFGRAGRQGDPGSAIAFLALEDELIRRHTPPWARLGVRRAARRGAGESSGPTTRRMFNRAQHRAERLALSQRKSVLRTDDWLDEFLGFAGREL